MERLPKYMPRDVQIIRAPHQQLPGELEGREIVTRQHPPLRLMVVMPLRDDWTSAAELIRRLDGAISCDACTLEILLVDDASVERYDQNDFQASFSSVRCIRRLRLRRNLGHQRAIAIGLVYVHQTTSCDAVIVMDADGEDTPEGVAQLLRAYSDTHGAKAIFAERSRRSESFVFRFFYHLYKFVHRCLTGIGVRVGNFSILPSAYLNTLVVMSELWNHYAAAVFRSKLPFTMIPIPRGTRIAGTSRMNSSLWFPTVSAPSQSSETLLECAFSLRLWRASLLAALGIVLVVMIRFLTTGPYQGGLPTQLEPWSSS